MILDDSVLRWYQREAAEKLREGIRAGHRSQMLYLATGAGKTLVGSYFMAQCRRKSGRAAFIVDRINLCDQTSAVLDSYGLEHGVLQAGHWRFRPWEPLQVCTAQTIERRGFPALDLLIVDEAHCVREQTAKFITQNPRVKVIGLTATPFTKGLSRLYSNLISVTTTNKLIEEGHLVPLQMYAAKSIDMTGAKVIAGEWAESEIEKRGRIIIGDIVKEWVEKTNAHFGGPAKTICFSATVDHGAELCNQFQEAGFNFQQISYRDGNDDSRRELIEEFRKPNSEIVGLVSCEVLGRGFDVPDTMVGISARPYRKSFSSHIQQLGRVMRPAPGKSTSLWLCHSGNALRFYGDMQGLFESGISELDDGKRDAAARKEPTEKDKKQLTCSCGYLLSPKDRMCPACGKVRQRMSMVEQVNGEMHALTGEAKKLPEYLQDRESVLRQIWYHALDRKGGDESSAEKFARAQYRSLYGTWPRHAPRNVEPEVPHPLLVRKIQQMVIAWAKRKAA